MIQIPPTVAEIGVGLLTAVFSALIGVFLSQYYREMKNRQRLIKAMYRELIDNRNQIGDEIDLLKEKGEKQEGEYHLEMRLSDDAYQSVRTNTPTLYFILLDRCREVIEGYQKVRYWKELAEMSRQPLSRYRVETHPPSGFREDLKEVNSEIRDAISSLESFAESKYVRYGRHLAKVRGEEIDP